MPFSFPEVTILCAGAVLAAWGAAPVSGAGSRELHLTVHLLLAGGYLSFSSPSAGRALLVLGTSAALAMRLFRSGPSRSQRDGTDCRMVRPALPALVLALWLVFREWYARGAEIESGLAALASCALLWSVLDLRHRLNGATRLRVARAAALQLGLLLLGATLFGSAWAPCRPAKCSPFGALLDGSLPSENTLGLYAGLLMLLINVGSRLRILPTAAAGLVLAATGSRTSLSALALAVAIAFTLSVLRSRRGDLHRVRPRHGTALAAAALVIAVIAIATASPTALSMRGAVWGIIAEEVGVTSIAGLGVGAWPVLQYAYQTDHHPHSQAAYLLLGGGWVALLLYGAFLACLLTERAYSSGYELQRSLRPLLFLAAAGMGEIFWNPMTLDGLMPLVALALLATSNATDAAAATHTHSHKSEPPDARTFHPAALPLGRSRWDGTRSLEPAG